MHRKKKRIIYSIPVVDITSEGKSVAKDDEGVVYFVDQAVPGDIIDILIRKKRKNFFEGLVYAYHSYGIERTLPKCRHFGTCGGCRWQQLDYAAQLKYKHRMTVETMMRIGKIKPASILPIKEAKQIFSYRNKMEYTFSTKQWVDKEEYHPNIDRTKALGLHARRSFDKIVNIHQCHLQENLGNDIRNHIRQYTQDNKMSYYNILTQQGTMRNVIIRNTSQQQWMVILSFAKKDQHITPLMKSIVHKFPQITSLYYLINKKFNDTILDQKLIHYHGKTFITEQLGNIRYNIGPKSFFQTNTQQANILFDTVLRFASLNGTENVYDLYTGIGSIALYISQYAMQVVGIEEVMDSVKDAQANAIQNNINNVVFHAGNIQNILTPAFCQQHGLPDVIITDPPRAGMSKKTIEMLIKIQAPKIVYVSCNPATQARDLSLLESNYQTIKIQPIDMFPHTYHIENVALLLKK